MHQIEHNLVRDGTTWRFNPPSAPHFGGIWESAVKSAKFHLKRMIGEHILTFVELATVLCQIEVCMNSRPLVSLSDDPGDPQPLTPSHVLIRKPSFLIPDPDLTQ